ncbi:hypothetical protein KPL40_03850 [Clostridium gasigenes]|nr:hypothetical protein [Clostridium gasigenes]MBU3131575.1 hypothetical protein [Clostridium gasigenes]
MARKQNKKRLIKIQYPASCDKCDLYKIAKKLITNNCCMGCPNRKYISE